MTPLPISVAMVSAAEADRIGRALHSVAGWTREIVIVLNDDARDQTENIARSFGAKVFREPWKGFISQKNSAAAKTTSEWILDLDADEVVSPALRADIAREFSDTPALASRAAFNYPRLSWYCGRWIRHGDWYPDRQTRLWRRAAGHWGGIDPHAKLIVTGPVARLRGDLYHYSYPSINRQVQRIVPYSDDFVRQPGASCRRVGLFHLLARPAWRFLRGYVLRLGFLDGWPGYYIAWTNAFSCLTRYAKLKELQLPQMQAESRPPTPKRS